MMIRLSILWTTLLLAFSFVKFCECDDNFGDDGDLASEALGDDGGIEGDTVDADGDNITETFAIVLFGGLFAIAVSFIAVAIAYFAILEDGLMRIFTMEGMDLQATVISSSFSRATTTTGIKLSCYPASPKEVNNEYIFMIEYHVPGVWNKNKSTVLKQVKALESDLGSNKERSIVPNSISLQQEVSDSKNSLAGNEVADRTEEGTSAGGNSYVPLSPQSLEVLVLREFPRSAIPRRQVERQNSSRYRIPTIILVVLLMTMSAFCVHLGTSVVPQIRESMLGVSGTTVLLMSILVSVDILGVHHLLRGMLKEGLRDLYLEGGEYVTHTFDDTTLSSGDDTFLGI